MSRLTVSEAAEEIAEAANLCATDTTRICAYINKAVRRLLPKGKWRDTYARMRICSKACCITFPRQVDTVEAVAVCGVPGTLRDQWFEFLIGGPGTPSHCADSDDSCGSSCLGNQMVDRGEHPAFDDIVSTETDRKIRVYADVAESATAKITLQGYDENGNWIRTLDGATWIDGEKVLISTTPQLTTKFFTKLSRVIKPVTNGVVRLYEYNNTTAANVKALAFYEPDETIPMYRRYYMPSIAGVAGGSGESACDTVPVDLMVKLRFVPVRVANDFVMIGNLPALVEMVRAIRKYENNLFTEGAAHEALAVKYLDEELRSFLGDGAVVQMRVESRATFGAGMVEGPISGSYYW